MVTTIKIGYFCTAGYTETGGIQDFLGKLRPDVVWERCFPAAHKPNPKLGRLAREPRPEDSGVTGRTLVERMLERLERYHRREANPTEKPIDLVVLIDDADCRFKEDPQAFQAWTDDLRDKVRRATERPELDIVVLLASPEVESWLLSDWEESFGREYVGFADRLREHLEKPTLLGPAPWSTIEDYGGRYVGGSCERKLSEDLQSALEQLLRDTEDTIGPEETLSTEDYYYSKKLHGVRMLRRIRPEALCTSCSRYFKPAFDQLMALKAPPHEPPPHKAKRGDRSREGFVRPSRGPRRS